MDVVTQAELTALGVMAFVIALKTWGFYMMKKRTDPEVTSMAPQYIVTAMLGLLAAYSTYQVHTTDVFVVFREASMLAIGFNLLFDVPSKFSKG